MKARKKALGIIAGTAAIGVAAAIYATKRRRYAGIKMKKSIVIDRSPTELYAFWRQLENVPQIVGIIESIQVRDEKRSHWTGVGPGGLRVTWDAEITTDRENEMIGWRSIDGSMLETAGYIRFERAPGGRGTLVRVALEYSPPSGRLGGAIASILGKNPGTYLDQALRRFKQQMEVGEIARAS
jgi:uncharacterized membrane protein